MKMNEAGRQLIKRQESLQLQAYLCPAGVWTCGWGATGPDVCKGTTWSQQEADMRFDIDVLKFANGVAELVTREMNDNQFSAVVCLAYNIGLGAFKRSTLLNFLNRGMYEFAAKEFEKWNKTKGVVSQGLTNRRREEQHLFMTPVSSK